ncbi:synemin [Cololabis saira]|uniref:synemin n=1 Tax=Cololabis saira TaxID=129043 RepID=UPI002AD24159|nr:synemin [Cololabis saira]
MLPYKRTFQVEKQQLQELNSRLGQYLSRTKQLEQENACLITEINKLRQVQKKPEWEQKCRAEMQGLRRMVGQLSFEKSQAEMERERLWRELRGVRSLCSEQTEVCTGISGELQGCETQLQQAHKVNTQLQQRLVQLENEYVFLEDAHREKVGHLRQQVESRVVPIITQAYPGVVSVEEVQEYARGLSQGWMETFEMYQEKVEEMEQAIKADQARLSDLQTEKRLYASEVGKLRTEAEKQAQVQMHLEEQLMHMQERFRVDLSDNQMIIEQLEHERNMMADAMAEKMREHQHLLQIRMDLGMEVAAYRALLEGERIDLQDAHRRVNKAQRERIIDIKMPAQPYTPRVSTLNSTQRMDFKYMPTTNLSRSPLPHSGSLSPSRVIPISVAGRSRHESPASRRDMISFNKARAASSITTVNTTENKQAVQKESQMRQNMQETIAEEKTVKLRHISQESQITTSPESKSIRVVSPSVTSLGAGTGTERKKQVLDVKEASSAPDKIKVEDKAESATGPGEKKILDSVSVEEIIEKVIKPAGLDAKVCSSGDSKVRYHVEKTEQEDGTTKTQIVLESKVEEELDISEDSALEEILKQGVTKVSLEDIDNTPTGSMIKNLISSLQGGDKLLNKSVNVEIIEEPVESHSDEELEVEQKSRSSLYEPSAHFQIEELENAPYDTREERRDDGAVNFSLRGADQSSRGSVQVLEVSRERGSPNCSDDQDSHEYFVSTPDDNLSEPDEVDGITSYGHYGIVDDLSDERYYQDGGLPQKRVIVEESDEYVAGDHSLGKESFPECIIEEEVRVSPIVQESVLGYLREDSLEPKQQLKGALEKLQGSISGPLKEELAFLTKVSSESSQNVAIKKVEQSSDNGTTTIVAELNVCQSLEDSGLLEAGDDLSEEQIMAALRSSNLELEKVFMGGAGVHSIRVLEEDEAAHDEGFEDIGKDGKSASEIIEKHIKLGAAAKSFTWQMGAGSEQELQSHSSETQGTVSSEKRVATVYLENPLED